VWDSPIYRLSAKNGKQVVIDVTSSVSAGLEPHKIIADVAKVFRKQRVETILDFGAGALRHTLPLLTAGFQVCAVEFEEQYKRPTCATAVAKARRYANFCSLIWPKDFLRDKRKFDAALLCFVIQTMPIKSERESVIEMLHGKLRNDSYLLWMARYGQTDGIPKEQELRDGYYMYPDRDEHSFYAELSTETTHKLMEHHDFHRVRSLGERGTDQVFLYGKGRSTWI
jgi:hypothetical protein